MTTPAPAWMNFIDRRRTAIVAVLIALIAALHFGSLNRHSLANNEFITLRVINLPTAHDVIVDRVNNNHSPGYFLLVRAWTQVFGKGQVSLRFPSAIFSFIGILALWRLGAFLYGARLGLLALAFAGFCQAQLQLSADTRMYSMLFCALALGLWGAVRWLEGGGPGWLALLVGAGFIGLGSQLLYILGPVCLAAWCAVKWRQFDWRRALMLGAAVLPILIFLPMIWWWKQVQYKVGVYKYPHMVSIPTLLRNLTTLFLGDPEFLKEDSALGQFNVIVIAAGFVLTVFPKALGLRRSTGGDAPAADSRATKYLGLLWLWALGPWVLIAIAGMKSDDNVIKLWRYYVMIGSAAPLLLTAMVAALNGAGRTAWATALGVYLMLTILTTTVQFVRSDGPGLREVAKYIQPRLEQGDLVLASMTRRRTDSFPYYGLPLRPAEVPYEMTDLEVTGGKPLKPILPWLQARCQGSKRLWAIYYNHKNDLLYKVIKEHKDQFVPLERKLYVGGETSVGLYEIKVPAMAAITTETTSVVKDLP